MFFFGPRVRFSAVTESAAGAATSENEKFKVCARINSKSCDSARVIGGDPGRCPEELVVAMVPSNKRRHRVSSWVSMVSQLHYMKLALASLLGWLAVSEDLACFVACRRGQQIWEENRSWSRRLWAQPSQKRLGGRDQVCCYRSHTGGVSSAWSAASRPARKSAMNVKNKSSTLDRHKMFEKH